MRKWEYCELRQDKQQKDRRNNWVRWVASLYTTEGSVEFRGSEAWMEPSDITRRDFSHWDTSRSHRVIMIAQLGAEGWERISGDGNHDMFKRAVE